MSRRQRHVIQTSEFEIRLADEAGAPALHGLMSRLSAGPLAALLDRYCSQLSSPDTVYRIDTLELDLGTLPADNLESVFVKRFEAALAARLPALIRAAGQVDARRARDRSALELLAFFLQTGALPWWAADGRPGRLRTILRDLIRHEPLSLRELLFDLLKQAAVRKRLATQLDAAGFQALLRLLLPQMDRETLKAELLAPELARAAGRSDAQIRQQLREMLLARAVPVPEQAQATADFFQHIAATFGLSTARLIVLLEEKMVRPGAKKAAHWRRLIRQLQASSGERPTPELPPDLVRQQAAGKKTVQQISDEKPGEAPPVKKPGPSDPAPGKRRRPDPSSYDAEGRLLTSNPAPGQKPRPDRSKPDLRFSEAEELFVDNAGLVVLGPFLPHFFRTAGLIVDNDWADETAPHRGVALLHFLLTGQEEMPEHQTPLLKIFCGIDPEEVLEYGDALEDHLKTECLNLLESVIAHASILRNMTPDGFRGSFLLRKGTLGRRDGHWLVRVERQAYDVVLDRFPWSFRLIKLPWLQRLIAVEW